MPAPKKNPTSKASGRAGKNIRAQEDFWINPDVRDTPPREARGSNDWGDFMFFIRKRRRRKGCARVYLGWYCRKPGDSDWRAGLVEPIDENPLVIKRLCELVLLRQEWFDGMPR